MIVSEPRSSSLYSEISAEGFSHHTDIFLQKKEEENAEVEEDSFINTKKC